MLIVTMIAFFSILVIGLLPDLREGFVASYTYVAKFFVFLATIWMALDAWVERFLVNKKKLNFTAILRFILLIVWVLIIYFLGVGHRAYYIIFEKQKTIVLNEYETSIVRNTRSPTNYYLNFEMVSENNIVKYDYKIQINEVSYNRLNRLDEKRNVNIIVTYKPKAKILYDLKILQK